MSKQPTIWCKTCGSWRFDPPYCGADACPHPEPCPSCAALRQERDAQAEGKQYWMHQTQVVLDKLTAAEADVLRLQAENDKLKTLLRLAEVTLSLDDEPEPQTFSTGGAPSPAPHTEQQKCPLCHDTATEVLCPQCWQSKAQRPAPSPAEEPR